MELEEAKKKLNNFILETNKIKDTSEEWHGYTNDELHELKRTVETVLQALDNSIPKEKVKQYLSEEQERFDIYKKGSKENENLKLGMWKHLGAKNMCELILGIQKNITTLD